MKVSEEKKRKGLFARLREGLSKTRGNMTEKVDEMVRDNRKVDEANRRVIDHVFGSQP